MTTLQLTFLGTFKVTLSGKPAKFRSANVRGLLVYLAMHHNRPIARERLTVLFWPEETDRIGRVNLRQTIFQLRKSLGDTKKEEESNDPPFLLVDRQSVQLNPVADIQTDTSRFLEAVKQDDLEAAGILFGGELLPGFICDSAEFEQWMSLERQRLNRTALDVLSKLTEDRLKQANFTAAKSSALKQLELEPWREMAHFQLMQALALSGEREAAIEQYEKLETILLEELGRSPQPETFELIQKIENNELGTAFELAAFELPPPFQAPTVPDYLVGRDAELEALTNMLTAKENGKEIIALVGMGGIGKTTLAAAVARDLQDQFPDGILWGNTLLSTAENILEMWAQAYGRDFSNIADLASLAAAVRGLLASKKVLIVLDNVTPTADIAPLLQPGSDCAMLITSRSHDASAAVGAEIFPVKELTSDSSSFLIERILDQKRLFEDEAARKAAKKIGDLLEHLPLAVEITAQLLKARPRMTLHHMVERLKDATQRRGLKISNKAVRASFELSWEMMTEELRTLFSTIGIFEGRSFTFDALKSIVETDEFTTEDDLYTLVSLSLVKLDGDNRFKQHPLLSDFAAEKLGDERPVLTKLVDYYLEYSKINALNFDMLQPEWDNLFALIYKNTVFQNSQKTVDFTNYLHESWIKYGQYMEACKVYSQIISQTDNLTYSDLAQLYLRWGQAEIEQNNYLIAAANFNRAKTNFSKVNDELGIAKSHHYQALILFERGDYIGSKNKLEHCVEVYTRQKLYGADLAETFEILARVLFEIDSTTDKAFKIANRAFNIWEGLPESEGICSTLRLLSLIEIRKSNFADAEDFAIKALEISKRINHRQEIGSALHLLLAISGRLEAYEEAEKLAEESLKIFRHLGNRRFEGMILHELGKIYLKTSRFNESSEVILQVIQIFQSLDDRLGHGYALINLGDIYAHQKKQVEAINIWNKAHSIGINLNHSFLKNESQKRILSISN